MTTIPKPSKLLIDLGNGDPIWIFPSLIKILFITDPILMTIWAEVLMVIFLEKEAESESFL